MNNTTKKRLSLLDNAILSKLYVIQWTALNKSYFCDDVAVSKATLKRHLAKLIQEGYIESRLVTGTHTEYRLVEKGDTYDS